MLTVFPSHDLDAGEIMVISNLAIEHISNDIMDHTQKTKYHSGPILSPSYIVNHLFPL